MLVSKLKPCMSKYKPLVERAKPRKAHYISPNPKALVVSDLIVFYLDNCGNSIANTRHNWSFPEFDGPLLFYSKHCFAKIYW